MMGFGLIFLVLIIGVIAYAVGWRPDFLTGRTSQFSSTDANQTPLHILKERYAQGEISKEEYLEMRNDLER
jgi:putative membrane protein